MSRFARRHVAIALIALLALAMVPSGSDALQRQPIRTADGPLRVMTFNVMKSNREFARFSEYLQRMDPDIVVLQEAGDRWLSDTPLKFYPFRRIKGPLLVASRVKFAAAEPVTDPARAIAGRSFMRIPLQVSVGGVRHVLALYNFHPASPRMSNGIERRRDDYRQLGVALEKEGADRAILVAGDYNATPGTDVLEAALRPAALALADAGTIDQPTRFGRELGLPTALGVPIDHVAASADVTVLARTVGPDLGSDHLPVTVDLRYRPTDPGADAK